ncbi:MAG: DUF72 domain-containing protein, partial [Bacteroidales bacterium]|nr:DUF72 domain-containing protein [Bacteroidales bacterium]
QVTVKATGKSHTEKLNHVKELLNIFFEPVVELREKLASILWQLPGGLHVNLEKLDEFCNLLDKSFTHVIEFRHNSWFTEEVFQILSKHNITLCLISAPDQLQEVFLKTSEKIYVRFHGKINWYNYLYTLNELEFWKNKILELKPAEVFLYFNNDFNANAVTNGKQMKEIFQMHPVNF